MADLISRAPKNFQPPTSNTVRSATGTIPFQRKNATRFGAAPPGAGASGPEEGVDIVDLGRLDRLVDSRTHHLLADGLAIAHDADARREVQRYEQHHPNSHA